MEEAKIKVMKQLIKQIKKSLLEVYPPTEIDSLCFLIINHITGFSKTELIVNQHLNLSSANVKKALEITSQLMNLEPIQYIIGTTEFYGLPFRVEPGVLIPRFETEELVDLIIKKHSEKQTLKILDMGTGSGCIAISLKKNLPLADVWCCDISDKAIEVTQRNAKMNRVEIHIEKFDILENLKFPASGFSLIVSNPPYIAEKERATMSKNVLNHEPELALFVPDDDPLLFYRAMIEKSSDLLIPGGEIFFEINEAYGKEMLQLVSQYCFEANLIKDINGKDRMIWACRNKKQ
jgi:release factor glutamine methyltransferase